MFSIPDSLRHGPFARSTALNAGIPARVLEGTQFVRIHQGVYRHRDHEMTWDDGVEAARLALPEAARTTGITRIQQLGLEHGPKEPLHFVAQGDLHLVHLLEQLLTEQPWRRGCVEARWVLPYLDGRCRSLPEAELLAFVVFAGLPAPEVNRTNDLGSDDILTPDLWFEDYGLAVEYEGSQHQEERGQYVADLDRYKLYRRNRIEYEQITKERMRSPKATVRQIHRALVDRGYDGPPDPGAGEVSHPHFDARRCGWATAPEGSGGPATACDRDQ